MIVAELEAAGPPLRDEAASELVVATNAGLLPHRRLGRETEGPKPESGRARRARLRIQGAWWYAGAGATGVATEHDGRSRERSAATRPPADDAAVRALGALEERVGAARDETEREAEAPPRRA